MGIFAQVWFWSALAFLAGALLSWALLALPARRQLARMDEVGLDRDRPVGLSRPAVPPLPERPGRYDDDDDLDRRTPSPFDDEPLDHHESSPFDDEDDRRVPSPFEPAAASPVLAPDEDYDRFSEPLRRTDRDDEAARTELFSGVDAPSDEPAERGSLRISGPTVQVPVSGSLEDDLFAPPEPPLPSRKDARPQPDESAAATQYLPAVSAAPEPARSVEAPAEVEDAGRRGWFEENGEAGADEPDADANADPGTVAVEPPARRPEADKPRPSPRPAAVEDEDADTGTIFTQRTQPVSGDLIARLDGKPEGEPESSKQDSAPAESASPEPAASPASTASPASDESEEDDADSPLAANQATSVLPVRRPGATRFDNTNKPKPSPEPKADEATQAMPSAQPTVRAEQPVEPEGSRSLFEPVVPADESATTAMPAPAAAAATVRNGDGSVVPPGPFGPGSAMPLPGGGAPSPEFVVKASVTALRYCEPDSPLFGRTVAEVWFRTPKDAERVGFRPLA